MSGWRETGNSARFFAFDARAAIALLIFLFHMAIWTFVLALVVMIVMSIIERFGLTVPAAGRWVKAFVAGPTKYVRPWWKHRRL